MIPGIIANLWCAVRGFEISEDEEDDFFDDYDPHENIMVDLLNIYIQYL
jgi:hypothetical protein